MKILVTGSREWTDWARIYRVLSVHPKGTILVHGHCPRGADRIADFIGQALGFEIHRHPADWNRYGRRAGPIRNREMLRLHPDIEVVYAFPVPQSRGTKDMIQASRQAGKDVRIYTQEEV